MRLLVDTCTFLWAVRLPARLPASVRAALSDPGNEVFLSTVSAWEIAIKHANGRLPLPVSPIQWVPDRRSAHGFESLPLDEESVLHLGRLPSLHRDPFDRVLVCQAIIHGLTIVTPDPLVTQYPARTMW